MTCAMEEFMSICLTTWKKSPVFIIKPTHRKCANKERDGGEEDRGKGKEEGRETLFQ